MKLIIILIFISTSIFSSTLPTKAIQQDKRIFVELGGLRLGDEYKDEKRCKKKNRAITKCQTIITVSGITSEAEITLSKGKIDSIFFHYYEVDKNFPILKKYIENKFGANDWAKAEDRSKSLGWISRNGTLALTNFYSSPKAYKTSEGIILFTRDIINGL